MAGEDLFAGHFCQLVSIRKLLVLDGSCQHSAFSKNQIIMLADC